MYISIHMDQIWIIAIVIAVVIVLVIIGTRQSDMENFYSCTSPSGVCGTTKALGGDPGPSWGESSGTPFATVRNMQPAISLEGHGLWGTLGSPTQIPSMRLPSDKKSLRAYWGNYLWGCHSRPFYDYGLNSRAPYPYEQECDNYARQHCLNSTNKWCYKQAYMKCGSGQAMADPELGKCCSGRFLP